ncbi:hypothetical protein FACS1894163_07020 [Spirochaetia bacterium]|nr:hypothetical protein FACS1894163_07020 [Spirochaetia bacterium]
MKPLPIGVSFFDTVIEQDYYYVDKTLLIKEMLDKKAAVNLFTRPRRFGKTLNMRMLQCFFENTAETTGKDTASLFTGLKIMNGGERYTAYMGQYPVVFLTFKDARMQSFESAYTVLKDNIADEFKRHNYVLQNEHLTAEKEQYERIMQGVATQHEYSQAVKFLSECLSIHHGKKAIILIDEYDVPLEASCPNHYYNDMVNFIRSLLGTALKDNPFLEFAAITGCLRISKESIFTGLNNLDVNSITGAGYSEYFGFTPEEMVQMLHHYGLESHETLIKDWYDGYKFGNSEVYNPWSLINIVKDLCSDPARLPEPYWANTSSNSIVRTLIDKSDDAARADLDTLIAGGTIKKIIHEDITYDEIEKSIDNIWNFLFFTGYLKKTSEQADSQDNLVLGLTIPNKELFCIYQNKIQEWFKETIVAKGDLSGLHNAVLDGNAEVFQQELSALLMQTISFYDNKENFYHGFLTGVLSGIDGYITKSNRESGNGRGDVVMHYANYDGKAVIFELKAAKTVREMSALCDEALRQIGEKKYEQEWLDEGYTDILKYGIAFYKKNCMVKKAQEIKCR